MVTNGEVPMRKIGSGNKKILSPRSLKILLDHMKKHNYTPTPTLLQRRFPSMLGGLSKRQIRRVLLEDLNLVSRATKDKPFMTERHKMERLSFARAHLRWTNK